MAKKKPKRAPGGGRKYKHGEPCVRRAVQIPESVDAMLGGFASQDGRSYSDVLVRILKQSVQYRLFDGRVKDFEEAAE